MVKVCGIYKITSPTGRIYIGQSVNVWKRMAQYKNGACKGQPRLYYSIKKHGWDNHKVEVLVECESCELNKLEEYYISVFNSFNSKTGLNLQSGGNRFEVSDETKRKLSERVMGPQTEEHKAKIGALASKRWKDPSYRQLMAIKLKGLTGPEVGYKHKEEIKDKISESRRRIQKIVDDVVLYECTGCFDFYSADDFYKCNTNRSGLTPRCKPCFREYYKNRYRTTQ